MTRTTPNIEGMAEFTGDVMMTLSRHLNELREEAPDCRRAVISFLGLDPETAEQIAAVTRPFRALPIDDATLGRIGWARLRLISPRVDAENWRDLVKVAQACSLEGLRALLQQGVTGRDRRTVLMTFSAEQYAVFESVLLAHGAECEAGALSGREAALLAALAKATNRPANDR
ncbi:hypothetical protein [Glycocaulis sp.]|uniref:hypothetical protein n=1 Tax=Glycocaulis sp. TaxID=1969725 RepID=UPI003D2601DF